MKRYLAVALAILLAVLGFWFGEGGSPPWAAAPVAGAVVAALAVALAVPGNLWGKSLGAAVSVFTYAGALLLGSHSFAHAFGECVDKGEEVRAALGDYHKKTNLFPERLGQLDGFSLCGRTLRPTVLEYERTRDGYVLSFKDWLVEHRATESQPFMAHK